MNREGWTGRGGKILLDQWEQRIAGILGVGAMEEEEEDRFNLPSGSYETLKLYRDYLKRKLTFPFEAVWDRETGSLKSATSKIKFVSLDDDADEFYGLLFEGKEGRRNVVVPLAELIVGETEPNFVLIQDYLAWFWNYR
jgi:hypothetical protein